MSRKNWLRTGIKEHETPGSISNRKHIWQLSISNTCFSLVQRENNAVPPEPPVDLPNTIQSYLCLSHYLNEQRTPAIGKFFKEPSRMTP
jgi:hypothetical protein